MPDAFCRTSFSNLATRGYGCCGRGDDIGDGAECDQIKRFAQIPVLPKVVLKIIAAAQFGQPFFIHKKSRSPARLLLGKPPSTFGSGLTMIQSGTVSAGRWWSVTITSNPIPAYLRHRDAGDAVIDRNQPVALRGGVSTKTQALSRSRVRSGWVRGNPPPIAT